MNHSDHMPQTPQAQQTVGAALGGYAAPAYQTTPVASGGSLPGTVSSPTFYASQQQVVHNQAPYFHSQQQHPQLQSFWATQMNGIEQTADFKNQSLPLARIKKIMKADEDVRMISAEAPVVFAKACEMFILELTLRSWIHTEENKRRTLNKNDIAAAISRTDVFDFLVDTIPRDELTEEGVGVTRASIPLVGSETDAAVPYYYMPPVPPTQLGGTGMMMGTPIDEATAGQQHQSSIPFMPWPPSHMHQPPSSEQGSDFWKMEK